MLNIKRKIGQDVIINDKIVVRVSRIYTESVILEFDFGSHDSVWRGEIWRARYSLNHELKTLGADSEGDEQKI